MLAKNVREKLRENLFPIIGVHVRMGDFRVLKEGENFAQVGSVRTPLDYFITIINKIRNIHGSILPVTIFTDGFISEIAPLLKLENTITADKNSDIVDLLLLSKSKVIISSAGSTFSYWAAFLSNAPVIMHPDHIHESIRPPYMNSQYYEGPFNGICPPLLKENILSIEFSEKNSL
jgi:hypothetical protein